MCSECSVKAAFLLSSEGRKGRVQRAVAEKPLRGLLGTLCSGEQQGHRIQSCKA